MQLTPKLLEIDPVATQEKITRFIRDYVNKTKAKGIILGVSGGIDSATTAALATLAIGKTRVLGVYMPEDETYVKTDEAHVKLLAKKFQFQLKAVDLTEVLSALYRTIPDYNPKDRLCRGNLKTRTRMLTLYYYANRQNHIVAASSDKSETMIGYYTKWGDAAADIAPIMDLYKTQVRQLAQHLQVPSAIVRKASTPALWPGQTAEEEIGLKYETLDLILYGLERFILPQRIAKQLRLSTKTITDVKRRWLQTEHKRKMPLTPKLEYRTIQHDFRITRTTEAI